MPEQPVDAGRHSEDAVASRAIATRTGKVESRPDEHELAGVDRHEMAPAPDGPVLSPDQLKPFNRKYARVGVGVVCVFLLAIATDNRQYRIGNYVCIAFVIGLLIVVAVDWWARRNGISRRE